MFSILGDLTGRSFLDLFSGSGVVGIEAASRGAEPVVLVESDRRKIPVMRENIAFIERKIRIVASPVEKYLAQETQAYDLIFLDPPFSYRKKEDLLRVSAMKGILRPGGILMIHRPSGDEMPECTGDLSRYRVKKYGGSRLDFYSR